MKIRIERPDIGESSGLAALHIACWREAYRGFVPSELLAKADLAARSEIWRQALENPDMIVLVARQNDVAAGFIMAGPPVARLFDGIDGQLAALYVAASHQRLGIGRRLLKEAASAWLRQGGSTLALEVLADNLKARQFYEKAGGRILSTGTYLWDGHPIAKAIYIFEDLQALAITA